MNDKVKFLQIVMSELITKRDTLEMDLNIILNSQRKNTENKKKDFDLVLTQLTETNNKITVMSEYLTQVNTPEPNKMGSQ